MPLSPALRNRVLERLGLDHTPVADLGGLNALYCAWCLRVPFDNLQKMIALRTAGNLALPGGKAEEFYEAWLQAGTGGTCWPGSNALFELIRSLGFDAVRVAGSMRDIGTVNHGSVRVTLEGAHWLVDSSLLTEVAIPLADEVFLGNDAVFAVEVERDRGSHLLWLDIPPSPTYLCCRLSEIDVTHDYFIDRYEASRVQSAFNDCVYARRNRAGEMLIVRGPMRWSKTAAGLASCELSPGALCECLRDDFGMAGALIDAWVASGSLATSFEPYTGPKAPEDLRVPPSQR